MRDHKLMIRRLKARALILAVTAIGTAFPVAAQQGNITLPTRKLSAEDVFENIQKQTVYKVAANSRRTHDLSLDNNHSATTVKGALDRLLDGSGLTYRVDGNFIIISDAPAQKKSLVEVNVPRNVAGTISDGDGTLEGVTVEFVDANGKQAVTDSNGRFYTEGVLPGRQVVKLTSADGATVRFREITVPAGSDADVVLEMGSEIMAAATVDTTAQSTDSGSVRAATKATTYFVPNPADNTVRAMSDEAKTEYSFIPSANFSNKLYMPKVGIKTNLLYLATTTPNLAVEFALGRKWTMDIVAGLNPWDLNDRRGGIRHGLVQPEFRYWFCQRFEKHFIGLHGIYGQYEIADINLRPIGNDLRGIRYNGWGAGVGLSWGYHLPMAKRWAWEFTIGAGYIYLDYDKYSCGECANLVGHRQKHYFGITKAGVSLVLMIK